VLVARGILSRHLYDAMDVDERAAVVRRHLPPALLEYAEAVLQVLLWIIERDTLVHLLPHTTLQPMQDAALRFPRSPLQQLFIARFYQVYSGQPWQAMGHLMRALRLGAPLDVEFVVYAARRAIDSQVHMGGVIVCCVSTACAWGCATT